MHVFSLLRAVVVFSLFLCALLGGTDTATGQKGQRCPAPNQDPRIRPGAKTIRLVIDTNRVKELQKAFEEGHQPWRGETVSVAANAIAEALGNHSAVVDRPDDLVKQLVIECEMPQEAVVSGEGSQYWYKVYLKRLARPIREQSAIWTAVSVVYAPRQ